MQEHSASLDLAASRAAQAHARLGVHGQQPGPAAGAHDDNPSDPAPRPFTVRDRRFWARGTSDAAEADAEGGRADKPSYVRELEDKLAQAEAKTAATLAQYQAARADFEAARARMRRDLSREIEAGKRDFLAELLDIVDNLDRALAAGEGSAQAAAGADATALREGVTLVHRLFLAKLARLGVQPMSSMGAAFDAQRHEALATLEVGDPAADGRVQAVVREGYLLHDTTLRTAQVAVGRLAASPGDGAGT